MLIRPGKNIHEFIHNDRNRLVKPMVFVIICSLLYSVAQQLLNFEDGYVNAGGLGDSAVATIYTWIQKNYGYTNILMAVFIAGWIKLLFRKYDYNFFEIIILLFFVMGIGMLIYTIFGLLDSLIEIKVLQIGGILGFIYVSWAIGQFFDRNKKINYLKGLLAYVLGTVTFFLIASITGIGIDFVL
ncbi:DUF3667 domain-containing protein [Flavobacteriaceae bacterium R38]|nr:DUF3667 domain-containing protein [Flavobacteriaceae bacterium R38]